MTEDLPDGTYRAEVEEGEVLSVKASRPPGWLALLLLGITTLVAVAAMAVALVVPLLWHDTPEVESEVLSALGTLGTLGIGALAALLGGEKR